MQRIFQFERSFITAYKDISSSNLHVLSFTKPTKLNNSLPSHLPLAPFRRNDYKKSYLLSPAVASIPYQPINVEYLETEFRGHGVAFQNLNEGCVLKMILDNGSMATTMMLPSGLITSYKVTMWHGGTLEMLHTLVSQEMNGEAVIQGGISSEFKCRSDGGIPWSLSVWSLHDVRGNSMESIQVELISRDAEDKVEVKYIVTLKEDTLRSELVVSNLKSSNLEVVGSFASHLTLSSPEVTYATGLEGSNIFEMSPQPSVFRIVPPDSVQRKEPSFGKGRDAINNFLFSSLNAKNQKMDPEAESKGKEKEVEEEEMDNYKHLAEKMSRIYTNAPRKFTIIDRGRRNSVVFGREGFDEVYFFSPGSRYESYSKYAYITIGPSAMLKPINLSPHGTWCGLQYLHNPNLSA